MVPGVRGVQAMWARRKSKAAGPNLVAGPKKS
jgi:hypothetical protein